MKPVFVTASTVQELSLLIRIIGAAQDESIIFPEIHRGRIGQRQVIIAVTGVGKVNAASAVTLLLQQASPEFLINTGCAGAYAESGLAVGDLAVATSEIHADEGVLTADGWQSLELIGIPLITRRGKAYFNEFPLSLQATRKALNLATALGLPMKQGKFLTVSTCSGTSVQGAELVSRYSGICENMEGAAVAQVAMLFGIDCLEIRGISNMVEDRDLSLWDIPRAAEAAQRFILKFIEEL